MFISNKYKERGKNGRASNIGGWPAIAERRFMNRMADLMSKAIDDEVLRLMLNKSNNVE